MADNSTLPATGDIISTDEITTRNGVAIVTGEKVQRIKVGFGSDGVLRDVDSVNGLPVTGTFFQTTQPVSGALSTTGDGFISTVNSSAVALGIGGVFTGAAEDITEYADIRVTVFSDQASAVDGLQIQQSSNGTNWDISDTYTIPASTGKVFSVAASSKFYRIVYTNGGAAQTALRLQVKFNKDYTKGSSVRPQDARANDNDFEEALSHLMGYNGASWDRLRASVANGLAVDVTRLPALPSGSNSIGALTSASLAVTATAVANTAVTATLPAPGAGLFHYITGIEVMRTATAALAGSATLNVTTTNLPGSLAWSFGNAMAAGATQRDESLVLATPLKSSVANTATTVVAPIPGLAVLWRINVYYYTAA